MPERINKTVGGNTETSTFTYGADHQRTKQSKTGSQGNSTIYYAGAMEVELNSNTQALITLKTYWPGGLGVDIDKPDAGNTSNTKTEQLWTHQDRLGSPIAISNSAGVLVERLAYDSWGKRRSLAGNETPDSIDGKQDNKGFTGHEMLDQLDLVHMNGRIYDPQLARFMSADPIIQDPTHSQSYNRYTYVWNNPTNLTDPTGFVADGFWSSISNFFSSGDGSQTTTEPTNEGSKTGSADNSGGQGKPSQIATSVIITGSLANARFEQWLLAETVKAAYGLKDFAVKNRRPLAALGTRVAARTGGQMAAGTLTGPAAPLVEGLLIIGGVYQVGKGIYDIVKMNGEGDTSAEDALDAGSGANSATGSPPPDDDDDDYIDEPKKRGEKGQTFRGGKKAQRDNWYGQNDKDFQKWWHREGKADFNGGRDIQNSKNAQDAMKYWKDIGKPVPK